jgi:hypothetical protein
MKMSISMSTVAMASIASGHYRTVTENVSCKESGRNCLCFFRPGHPKKYFMAG